MSEDWGLKVSQELAEISFNIGGKDDEDVRMELIAVIDVVNTTLRQLIEKVEILEMRMDPTL